MTADRWFEIERLYHSAAALDEQARGAFLTEACAGDEELREDVEGLLVHESSAEGFLSNPPLAMPLLDVGPSFIGRQLGPFTIHSLLGAGGMGEVYRARDTRLERDVAIKILPRAFTSDQRRLAQLEREARTLASLNHLHIGSIYGLEEADGVLALILELVEGVTLADRLEQAPIPPKEALVLAGQICDALSAAHDKGIVHRDLKPANIKITPAGLIKVLDFGLAKSAAIETSPDGLRSAKTTESASGAGVLIGTAPYMSPEHARRMPVDKRADIWAFGCILFEMLTGQAAFLGKTTADTVAAILEREPDWGLLSETTHPTVRRVLKRCLHKDPAMRVHDIADARLDLGDVESETPPGVGAARKAQNRTTRGKRAAWILVGMLSTVAAVMGLSLLNRPAAADVEFSFSPPEGEIFSRATDSQMLAVSPDGLNIAFLAQAPGAPRMIWLRALGGLGTLPVPGTEGADGPFWKPDSRSIGFFTGRKLKTVQLAGGDPQMICEEEGPTHHATWNQFGEILFVGGQRGTRGLYRVPDTGGTPTQETEVDRTLGETGHLWPYFLPDGRHYLYAVTASDGGGIYSGLLGARPGHRFLAFSKTTGTSSLAYGSPGEVLFATGNTLMGVPFDVSRLEKTGEPRPRAEGVLNIGAGTGAGFSVSRNGVLAYWPGGPASSARLAWFTRAGVETPIAMPLGDYRRLSLAPDERHVAVERVNESRAPAIWVFDLELSTQNQYTFDAFSIWPVFSPRGDSFIFSSMRDGALAPYRQSLNAREDAQPLFDAIATQVTDWSKDDRILYQTGDYPVGEIGVFTLSKGATPISLLHTSNGVSDGQFSPDGRWMAYVSAGDVFVTSLPGTAGPWPVSTNGGRQPRWSRDGTELYYLAPHGRIMAVKITATPIFDHGAPLPVAATNVNTFAVGRNGRFLVAIPTQETNVSTSITVHVKRTAAFKG